MADICFITTCMGRLGHLKKSLPTFAGQAGTACVVVDYSCPQQAGAWVQKHFPQVRLVSCPGKTHYERSHAHNLGAAAAQEPWLCFVDADVLLTPVFAASIRPLLKPRHFFRAKPRTPELGGTMLCTRQDFLRVGGYDEVLRGWGMEDDELYGRMKIAALQESWYPAQWLVPIPHADDLRTQFHEERDHMVSASINKIYSQIKMDIMLLRRRLLPIALCRDLYRQVEATVRQAIASNTSGVIEIPFARWSGIKCGAVETRLRYIVQPTQTVRTAVYLLDRKPAGDEAVAD